MTSDSGFSVDQLLRDASPRARLSNEDEQELFDSVHTQWRASVNKRRRRNWVVAAAATLVLGLFVANFSFQKGTTSQAPVMVARVEAQFGVTPGSELAVALLNSTTLNSGLTVKTSLNERLALDLTGGGKLRLNQNTVVRLMGKQTVELLSGSVYYDSYDRAPAILDSLYEKNSVSIHTPFGLVKNKGTQFLVDSASEKLTVTVRSGQVNLAAESGMLQILAGKQTVLEQNRSPQTTAAPSYGDTWSWVEHTLPDFDLNQAPLTLLLEWVGHETGREIIFSSQEAMQLAQTSVLVGKVDLLPLDALRIWIETVDLEASVSDKHITIALRP